MSSKLQQVTRKFLHKLASLTTAQKLVIAGLFYLALFIGAYLHGRHIIMTIGTTPLN